MTRLSVTGYQNGNTVSSVLFVLVAIILIVAAGYVSYVWQHDKVNKLQSQVAALQSQVDTLQKQAPSSTEIGTEYLSPKGIKAILFAPASGEKVTSPTGVIGTIPGNWSFEASFPAQLKDNSGAVISQSVAHVLGNWMTDQQTPFSVQFTYTSVPSGSGTIVLQKDNPSGLPANDDSIVIPVRY